MPPGIYFLHWRHRLATAWRSYRLQNHRKDAAFKKEIKAIPQNPQNQGKMAAGGTSR